MQRYRVGIAGATGLVGQRLIAALGAHPWFEITALGASERSSGAAYRAAARWLLPAPIPEPAASMNVGGCASGDFRTCDLVLSALDAPVAREVEPALADAGVPVISNSSAYRMDPRVPLIIPEVNGRHADVVGRRPGGFIVTNPNCSVIGLALALAPLHAAFGVERVIVSTMQSASGAGLSGPRAIELMDNVVPFIAGEEDKIEAELGKLLGGVEGDLFAPATFAVSAHCNRVPTLDGHLEAVSVGLASRASAADAIEAMTAFRGDIRDLTLPTAPERPIVVRSEPDRPQTRLDRETGSGMSVVVGRVRPCPVLTLRLVVLSHNMIRGAAGAALLNAELLAARGLLRRRPAA